MTKNPVIWFQYFCWCAQNWMSKHTPYYPLGVRIWLHRLYPDTIYQPQHMIDSWRRFDKHYNERYKPPPWYIGMHCQGPFMRPWRRIQAFFRGLTGGLSHRCEFTDKKHGALYGHKEGAFMNELFEQFIENISVSNLD